jgi:alpha-galactosidase
MVAQWRQVAGCMLGDYYPLTPHSLGAGDWIAWQFDRPEQGDGMIQAFRREENGTATLMAKLRGLEASSIYLVSDLDAATSVEVSGSELLERGLSVVIKDRPGSALIYYRKKS